MSSDLERQLSEANAALQALRREQARAGIRAELTAELVEQFGSDAAQGIADSLADRCELDGDNRVVMGAARGAKEVLASYLSGPGAYLKPLAKQSSATANNGFDPARVAEPAYGAEWREKDPESYKAAMDAHIAERAKVQARR